ncbi:MAG: helix-turn-helix domain-containing protein [Nitrospiraceae bacterium]|nr:helix-turn-helix domain-containing protein [Nitrospiraceae bacterium]
MTNLKSSQEIARLLRVSRQNVHKLTTSGALPAYKVGRNFRYSAEEVLAAVKTRKRRRQEN